MLKVFQFTQSLPRLTRALSSLVGRTGRVYCRTRVLQSHPQNRELDIYLAASAGRHFVLKPVSQSIYDFSQELRDEFGSNCRLRTHVDENEDQHVLVYEYLMGDLFSLIKYNADIPIKPRIHILREVGMALKAFHDKDYIHLDLKPNNIMLDWTKNQSGEFQPERVVLADLDCALKLKDNKLLNHRIGNVMWRSPEGQAGRGIGKPSEVFSFGLLCFYTITGAETLHPDFQKLREEGIEPEHLIFYRLLSMFGPVPPGLVSHVDDDFWQDYTRQLAEVVAEQDASERFMQWDESILPNLDLEVKRLVARMTNLDPAKRATLNQIMEDPFWQ